MASFPAVIHRSRAASFALIGYMVVLMMMMSFLTRVSGPEYPLLPLAPIAFGLAHLLVPRLAIPTRLGCGSRAYAKGDLDTAISEAEASYGFFESHSWIDRFRLPILLSTSAMSMREAALYNIAFFLTQQRRREDAKRAVQRLLAAFPDSILGKQMMTTIETFEGPGSG